ncbi:NAD(P)-dependent oxidoreductase [Stenotrophomonas maltophilia]|uniref:NAD(P)-dependent oxidoreductase n=1 Tax=Stenotrophomonas maltophilia TaxID=40324 RepID=UPI0009B2613B|nr:NAD(P)-dependent oxidoreductase [Stenotrophomonas maltophilia]
MSLGFIGLGVMGTPMAGHLARAGHPVLGWSRSGRTAAAARSGGVKVAAQLEDVFAACGTVILMLANDEAIDSVLDRQGGAFGERVRGRLLINMGTSSAAYSQALGEQIRAAGGRYVEAPVSGSRVQAEAAQLVILLAGTDADLAVAAPLLAPMGRQTVCCGNVPSALRMKLAVNLYLITLVTGLAEAVHFAEAHGIELERFAQVLNAGPMASDVSRIKLDKMARGDFAVQASITDVHKNSALVAAAAREAGMHAPLIEASDALFAQAQQAGLGALDMAAVLEVVRAGPAAAGRR